MYRITRYAARFAPVVVERDDVRMPRRAMNWASDSKLRMKSGWFAVRMDRFHGDVTVHLRLIAW
jgi:hypothetical protein